MQVALHDITLAYGHQTAVLSQLTCKVPDGELTALLGPSGSGKSTILNLLAGLLTPTAGQILFDNTDVTNQDSRQRHIGMVFQDYALYPHLNVRDNIAFPLKMAHVNKKARYHRVAELAELVQIADQLTKFPHELSGGQQQRVAIARALIKQPSLLLLDEPLSSLDTTLREELRTAIRDIQRATGVTTIFVTHDQEDALQIADHIMILSDGRLQQVGTGHELYQHPSNLTVAQFVGRPKINLIPLSAISTEYLASLPANLVPLATTLGIRSEALQLSTPSSEKVTATIDSQIQLGRDTHTHLHIANQALISTAIPKTTVTALPLTINIRGCCLFADDGTCLWAGAPND